MLFGISYGILYGQSRIIRAFKAGSDSSPFHGITDVLLAKTGTASEIEAHRLVRRETGEAKLSSSPNSHKWVVSMTRPTSAGAGPALVMVVYLSDTQKVPKPRQPLRLSREAWKIVDRFYKKAWSGR